MAKAQATITLERGRRVVAREELESLQGSLQIDPASRALALRKPQLRQVQAELAAAENQLQRAQLDLGRTRVALPHDVIVLERERVGGEVVAQGGAVDAPLAGPDVPGVGHRDAFEGAVPLRPASSDRIS